MSTRSDNALIALWTHEIIFKSSQFKAKYRKTGNSRNPFRNSDSRNIDVIQFGRIWVNTHILLKNKTAAIESKVEAKRIVTRSIVKIFHKYLPKTHLHVALKLACVCAGGLREWKLIFTLRRTQEESVKILRDTQICSGWEIRQKMYDARMWHKHYILWLTLFFQFVAEKHYKPESIVVCVRVSVCENFNQSANFLLGTFSHTHTRKNTIRSAFSTCCWQ